jgi:hypothetical protein
MNQATTVMFSVVIVIAFGCGKQKAAESDDVPIRKAAESAAASPSTAPSAAPVAPAPAAVQIPEKATTTSWSADDKRWMKPFKFGLPSGAMAGAAWADARRACKSVGRDLCSEDQWALACAMEAAVGQAPSWTVSHGSSEGTWVVRGGTGCAASADATGGEGAAGRIGLCCERSPAISSTKRTEAWLKSADVYIRLVEDALNSPSPDKVVNLLDEPAKLFKTTSSHDQARRNLRDDYKRYSEWDYRFTRCDADIDTEKGSFECDAVMTRAPAGASRELSVFRTRFEYGPPRLSYKVFADPVRVIRKWGAY